MIKYYTVNELAELLNITTRSVRNYIKDGKIHGEKIGGQWRFSEKDVNSFITGISSELQENSCLPIENSSVVIRFNLSYSNIDSLNTFKNDLVNYHKNVYANESNRFLSYRLQKNTDLEVIIAGNEDYVFSFSIWLKDFLGTQTNVSIKKTF